MKENKNELGFLGGFKVTSVTFEPETQEEKEVLTEWENNGFNNIDDYYIFRGV